MVSTSQCSQSNGHVERFNQTLKHILHHMIRKEWKRRTWTNIIYYDICYIIRLWSYREVLNSATIISPFQLLYNRVLEDSLSVQKSSWRIENKGAQLCTMPIHKYLNKLSGCLEKAANEARLSTEMQQGKISYHYNLRSKKKKSFR